MNSSETVVPATQILAEIRAGKDVKYHDATITGHLTLISVTVNGRLSLTGCRFEEHVDASDAHFIRTVVFTGSAFKKGLVMPGAKFEGGLWLNHVKVMFAHDQDYYAKKLFKQSDVNLRGITVKADCNASYLEVGLDSLNDTGNPSFCPVWAMNQTHLQTEAEIAQFEAWVTENIHIHRPCLILDSSQFEGILRFDGACIAGSVRMENVSIRGNLSARVPRGDLRWKLEMGKREEGGDGEPDRVAGQYPCRPMVVHGHWICDGMNLEGNFMGHGLRVREGLSLRNATVDGEILLDVDEGPANEAPSPLMERNAFVSFFGDSPSQPALRFRGIHLRGSVRLSGTNVLGQIDLYRAKLGGRFRIAAWSYQEGDGQQYREDFRRSRIFLRKDDRRKLAFRAAQAKLGGGLDLEGTEFYGDVDLSGAEIGDGLRAGVWGHEDPEHFRKVRPLRTCFYRDLLLPLTEVHGNFNLRGAWVRGRLNGENTKIHGSFHAHVWHERIERDRANQIIHARKHNTPDARSRYYGKTAEEAKLTYRFEWSVASGSQDSNEAKKGLLALPETGELSRTFSFYGARVDEDFLIMGCLLQGTIDLTGVQIGGSLLARTELLTGHDLRIENDPGFRVQNPGRLILAGAHVEHTLHLHRARIGFGHRTRENDAMVSTENVTPPLSLDLNNLTVGEDLRGSELACAGELQMNGLKVSGQLELGGMLSGGKITTLGALVEGNLNLKPEKSRQQYQTFRVGPIHAGQVVTLDIPLKGKDLRSGEETLRFECIRVMGKICLGPRQQRGVNKGKLLQVSLAESHFGGMTFDNDENDRKFKDYHKDIGLDVRGCRCDQVPEFEVPSAGDPQHDFLSTRERLCLRVHWLIRWLIRSCKAFFIPFLGLSLLALCLHDETRELSSWSCWLCVPLLVLVALIVWNFEKPAVGGRMRKRIENFVKTPLVNKCLNSRFYQAFNRRVRGMAEGVMEAGEEREAMREYFACKLTTGMMLVSIGVILSMYRPSRLMGLVLFAWGASNFLRFLLHGWLRRNRNREEEFYNRKSPTLRWFSRLRNKEGHRTTERGFFMQAEKLLRASGRTTEADIVYLRMEHWSTLGDRSPKEMSDSHRFLASFFFVTCGFGVRWHRVMFAWLGALLLSVLIFWDPQSVELAKVYPAEHGVRREDLPFVAGTNELRPDLVRVIPGWDPYPVQLRWSTNTQLVRTRTTNHTTGRVTITTNVLTTVQPTNSVVGAINYVYRTDGPHPDFNETEKGDWGAGARMAFAMRTMIPMIPQFAWDDYEPTSGEMMRPSLYYEQPKMMLKFWRWLHNLEICGVKVVANSWDWVKSCPIVPVRYDTAASVIETFSWVCLSLLLVSFAGWLKRRE